MSNVRADFDLIFSYSRYITVHSSVLFSWTNATKQIYRRFQPWRDSYGLQSPPFFFFSGKCIYTFHGGCVVRDSCFATAPYCTTSDRLSTPFLLLLNIIRCTILGIKGFYLFISIKVTYRHRWTFWAPAFLSGHDVSCMSDCPLPFSVCSRYS